MKLPNETETSTKKTTKSSLFSYRLNFTIWFVLLQQATHLLRRFAHYFLLQNHISSVTYVSLLVEAFLAWFNFLLLL